MSYIVSHSANFEPCGHQNYPDKEFDKYDDARDYYAKLRKEWRAKADKCIKDYPRLYSQKVHLDDLWQEDVNKYDWQLCYFCVHIDWSYHTFAIEEL